MSKHMCHLSVTPVRGLHKSVTPKGPRRRPRHIVSLGLSILLLGRMASANLDEETGNLEGDASQAGSRRTRTWSRSPKAKRLLRLSEANGTSDVSRTEESHSQYTPKDGVTFTMNFDFPSVPGDDDLIAHAGIFRSEYVEARKLKASIRLEVLVCLRTMARSGDLFRAAIDPQGWYYKSILEKVCSDVLQENTTCPYNSELTRNLPNEVELILCYCELRGRAQLQERDWDPNCTPEGALVTLAELDNKLFGKDDWDNMIGKSTVWENQDKHWDTHTTRIRERRISLRTKALQERLASFLSIAVTRGKLPQELVPSAACDNDPTADTWIKSLLELAPGLELAVQSS